LRAARLLAGSVLLGGWLAGAPAAAAQQAPCHFLFGFQALHDAVPNVVGSCVDDQAYAANGDAQQDTTKGLLAWRKADNWTAFTDGYRTWINGPNGVVSRLNTERFAWEAGPPAAPAVDPGKVLLNAGDQGVPPDFQLAGENQDASGVTRNRQSANDPRHYLASGIYPMAEADALAALKNQSAGLPRVNVVLGQPNAGFQNDGAVGLGDASTVLETPGHFLVMWVKGNYLLELDDTSGYGFGFAVARATTMESRLEKMLSA
jgi:hypothetical protein